MNPVNLNLIEEGKKRNDEEQAILSIIKDLIYYNDFLKASKYIISLFHNHHDLKDKRFILIPTSQIVEIEKSDDKNCNFIFKFRDCIGYWKYKPSDLLFEYRYNDDEKHFKYAYVLNSNITILNM